MIIDYLRPVQIARLTTELAESLKRVTGADEPADNLTEPEHEIFARWAIAPKITAGKFGDLAPYLASRMEGVGAYNLESVIVAMGGDAKLAVTVLLLAGYDCTKKAGIWTFEGEPFSSDTKVETLEPDFAHWALTGAAEEFPPLPEEQ